MSTAILVCGMHRSGTSATTGALRLAGVALGGQLLGPGEDNPKGYWENTRAVAIHEQLLSALGMSWDDTRELPKDWEKGTAAAEAAAQIHGLIDAEFVASPLWAIKDPRLCRFLPLWKRVLSERGIRAVALLVARHPDEVAASIARRNSWDESVGKLLWMRYVLESERHTRDMERAVITYDSLLADPVGALWGAAASIGIELPEPAGDQAQAFRDFVDAADRHHRHATGNGGSELDVALHAVYAALADAEGSEEHWAAFRDAAASVPVVVAPFSQYLTGLATMARHWQARHEQAEVELAGARSDLTAQVRWSEGAVERQESLHAELAAERARNESLIHLGHVQQALLEALQENVKELLRRADENRILAEEVSRLRSHAAELELAASENLRRGRDLEREMDVMKSSISWRITSPARAAMRWLRRSTRQ